MLEAGVDAPAIGDLADKGADTLLGGIAYYPEAAARSEVEQWLACRGADGAAGELLDAARGADQQAPLRRLHCQQALALVGAEAEPASVRCSTMRSWAASPGSGSPSAARRTYPRRRSR